MTDKIICPSCGCEIAVSETLAAQIRQQLRQEFETEARRKDNEFTQRLETILEREHQIETLRRSIEQEISNRVGQERDRLAQEAETKAKEAVTLEIGDLQGQLIDAKNKVSEAQKAELQLRQDRRHLEEQKQELELTVSRTLDQERANIREEAKRQADDDHRLQEADKDKLVADLRHQIDELKRKSEQGTPQAQGEIMELELEEILHRHFPTDIVEPVPNGTHGGDVLQLVHDSAGQECGTILWESKRTKSWSDSWLPKLRNDQRAAKAHLAVLASVEMPKGFASFGNIDGVWITNRPCLLGLAAALRAGLVEVARTKRTLEGQQTKIALLYNYFSGPEFSQRVEGIVEAFVTMKDDLESEKRSMHRLWAKREKQLDRAVVNTAYLYGDVGGILGAKLPQIANLEFPAITHDSLVEATEKAPRE